MLLCLISYIFSVENGRVEEFRKRNSETLAKLVDYSELHSRKFTVNYRAESGLRYARQLVKGILR